MIKGSKGKQNRPISERFWEKVDIKGSDECWKWNASTRGRGYGQVTINYKPVLAHRIAYQISIGPIPKGMCVLHYCDNPPCVNPKHLHLGTQLDNSREMVERGRSRKCIRHHNLRCSECPKIYSKGWYQVPENRETALLNNKVYRQDPEHKLKHRIAARESARRKALLKRSNS